MKPANYKTKNIMKLALFLAYSILSGDLVQAQSLRITGPSCVRKGVEYQYIVESGADSLLRMEVCLKGGQLAGTGQTCTGDSLLTEVRVIWKDSISGELTLKAAGNSISKTVNVAAELEPGALAGTEKLRISKDGSKPEDIVYTSAKGGGCNPLYVYQWQQSTDLISWTDISNPDKQRFNFSTVPSKNLYYRRKVIDTNSGNIAYSEPVTVFVDSPEKTDNPKN